MIFKSFYDRTMLFLVACALCGNPDCVFNVNGSLFDLSSLTIANSNYVHDVPDYGQFTFRLCGPMLDSPTLPSCARSGFSAACVTPVGGCYLAGAVDSMKVELLPGEEFDFKIEYGANTGDEGRRISEVITIHQFACDPSKTQGVPEKVEIDEHNRNRYITLSYRTREACPRQVSPPTPTPRPQFNDVLDVQGPDPSWAIHLNLSDFSAGEASVFVENEHRELFYSPAGTIPCPFPYNCRGVREASVFLCTTGDSLGNSLDNTRGDCIAYGVAGSDTVIEKGSVDGARVVYKSPQGQTANVGWKCEDTDLPLHEFKFYSNPSGDTNTVNFDVKALDACFRKNPYPEYCAWSGNGLSFDLRTMNNGNTGISQDVEISQYSGDIVKGKMFLQPCGLMRCPADYDCDDFVNSSVWLCNADKNCYSVGNAMTGDFELDVGSAIKAVYRDPVRKTEITITYACDRAIEGLAIEQNGTQSGDSMFQIRVLGNAFCVKADNDNLTGGAIFLICLGIAALIYFVGGTILVSVNTGVISIPHPEFWAEFGECVKDGFMFIATCGRGAASRNMYDSIPENNKV